MDSHFDENYVKQICDVCEEERKPEDGVYYCEDCDFAAEFNCVVSEVLLALRKKPQDVQLRTINRKIDTDMVIPEGPLTIGDMKYFITAEEEERKKVVELDIEKEVEEIRMKFFKAGHEANYASILKKFPYLNEALLRIIAVSSEKRRWGWNTDNSLQLNDSDSEVINVRDYKTTSELAGVVENLLNKYGDIGASCIFSPVVKSIILHDFCAVVWDMCHTVVAKITDELIFNWWWQSMLVHRAGLRVDFFFDHLKRIQKTRDQEVDPVTYQLSPITYHHEEMIKVSQVIKEGEDEMDQLRREQRDVISSIRREASRLEAEQLSKTLESLRMNAGTGLL